MPKNNLKFDPEHACKNNPNNGQFWLDLGFEERPENWREIYREYKKTTSSKNRTEFREQVEYSNLAGDCWPGSDFL